MGGKKLYDLGNGGMEHIRVKFLKGLGQVFLENSDVEGILNGGGFCPESGSRAG